MVDDDERAMALHLNLLCDQAEEALRSQASAHDQAEAIAAEVAQDRRGAIRRWVGRLASRRSL